MADEDYISRLLKVVADSYGGTLETPKDFMCFSCTVQSSTGARISVSSIKRLFGYVRYESRPSKNTLHILSQFAGFRDFKDFCCQSVFPDHFRKGSRFEIRSGGQVCMIVEYTGNRQFEMRRIIRIPDIDREIFHVVPLGQSR